MKVFITLFISAIIFLFPVMAQAQNFSLNDHKWKDRVVMVFSPNTYNQDYREQVDNLENAQEGIKERDLKIYYVLEESSAFARGEVLDDEDAAELRSKFEVSPSDYTVILIGKDGTEKLRTQEALSTKKLFKVIDAMPMRKLEMKEDGK